MVGNQSAGWEVARGQRTLRFAGHDSPGRSAALCNLFFEQLNKLNLLLKMQEVGQKRWKKETVLSPDGEQATCCW